MARQYSDDERARILAESYALLARDVTDTRQAPSEPEPTPEEIRQLAYERPTGNWRGGREFDEWKERKAAEREADTMEKLEARLNAKIENQRDSIFRTISQVVAEGIFEPYEKRFAELEESIRNRRDPVSVVGAAINHKNELMLTLSDGTILTPGRVDGPRDEVEPIDVPPVLRRVR